MSPHPGMTDKIKIHHDVLDSHGEIEDTQTSFVPARVQTSKKVMPGPDGASLISSFVVTLPPGTSVDEADRIEHDDKQYPVMGIEEMRAFNISYGVKVWI